MSDPPVGELRLWVTTLTGRLVGRGILGSASKLSLFSLGNVIEESLNIELNPEPPCSSLKYHSLTQINFWIKTFLKVRIRFPTLLITASVSETVGSWKKQ